jgi:hypothetical protein
MIPSGMKRWLLIGAAIAFSFRNLLSQVNLYVKDVISGQQVGQERIEIGVMGNELFSYEFTARFTNASAQPYSAELTIKSDIRDYVHIPPYVEGWQEKTQVFPGGTSLVMTNDIIIRPVKVTSVTQDSFYVEARLRYGQSPTDQLDISRVKLIITVYPLQFDYPVIFPEPEYTPGFSNALRWIPVKGTSVQEMYYFDRENPANRKKAIQRLYKQEQGDTLETVFQDLKHGHAYGYFVKAVFNSNGRSNVIYSNFLYSTQDAVPPSAVNQTQALMKNYDMVAVTWKKATDALSGVDRYRIYKTVNTSMERLVDSVSASEAQGDFFSWQEHTDSLAIFHYRVTAVDKAGNEGSGVLSNELVMPGADGSVTPPDPFPADSGVRTEAAVQNVRGVVDTLRVPLNGRETSVRFQSVRDSLRYFKNKPVDGMRFFDTGWLPLDSIPPDPVNVKMGRWLFDYTGKGAIDSNFVNGHVYYRRAIRKILAVTDTVDLGSRRLDCFMPDDIRNLKASAQIEDPDPVTGYKKWRIVLDWEPAMDAGSGLKRYHIYRKIDGWGIGFSEVVTGRPVTESQFSDSMDVLNKTVISNPLFMYRIVGEDGVGNIRPFEKTAWEASQRALGAPDWKFVELPPFTSPAGPDTLFTKNDSVSFVMSRFDLGSVYRLVIEKNGVETLFDLKGSDRFSVRLSDAEVTRIRIRALYAGGVSSVWTSDKWCIRALNASVKEVSAWTEDSSWDGNIYLKWARPSLDVKSYEIWRYRQKGDSVLAGLSVSKADTVLWTDEYNRNELTGKTGDPLPVYETLRYRIHKINRFDQTSAFSTPVSAYSNRPPLITSSALKNENNRFVIQIAWRRPYPNDVRKNFSTVVRIYLDALDKPILEDIVSNDDSLYTFRNAVAGRNYIFRIREKVNDDPLGRQSTWSRPYTKSLRELGMALQAQPKKRMYVAWDLSKVDSLRIQAFMVQRVGQTDTLTWTYSSRIAEHMDSTLSLVHKNAYRYTVFAMDSLNQILAAGTKTDTCDAGAAFIPYVVPFPMKYFKTPELDVSWEWKTVSGPAAVHTTRGASTCLLQVSLSRNFPADTSQTKTFGPFSADPEKRLFKIVPPRFQTHDHVRLFLRMTAADAWGHPVQPLWSTEFYGLVEASYDTVKPKPVTDMSVSGSASYYKNSDFVLAGLTWTSPVLEKTGDVIDRLVSNVDRYRIVRSQNNVEIPVFDKIHNPLTARYMVNDTIRNIPTRWKIITIDSAGNATTGAWIDTPPLTPTPKPPVPSSARACKVQAVSASGAKIEYFVEIAMRQTHFSLAYEVEPGSISGRLINGSGWFTGTEYSCSTGWGSIETDSTFFRVKARIGSWESGWSQVARFTAEDGQMGQGQQKENAAVPSEFSLSQNYPNPFNAETRMILRMPESGRVEVQLYSILGRRIKTLVQEEKSAGEHVLVWDGRLDDGRVAASGIFLAVVIVRSEHGTVFQKHIKMMMIK